MTKIIQVENDLSVLDEAAEALSAGQLVAFPTETVYGLGASALDEAAVGHIFEAKGRPQDNPLIVHVSNRDMLNSVVKSVPAAAAQLMETFWPGPLTIILEKSDLISHTVTAGLETVAVRMPNHPAALHLIEKSGVPVAAPSANLSGSPSTTRASHVIADLSGRVDYIIDGGACLVGLESTVLDMTGEVPQILRPGGVSLEALQMVLGEVRYEPALQDAEKTPKSPGMKYRHYAPKAELLLVDAGEEKRIEEFLNEAKEKGNKTGVLCCTRHPYDAEYVVPCGTDAAAYAHSLFDALRQMDDWGVELIIAELPADSGGIVPALKNRMLKAAGGRVVSDVVETRAERI
ncbi:MAG: threonylcarbamoyl-AMP synthase [Ruminococcaceae bacterium]|nr:threonylcarbamoyl-AMP synthase [Oscillospiraceae bacterium]